ncbi:hypothetical protein ACFL3E_01875 [Patescibacteria group bacterium]
MNTLNKNLIIIGICLVIIVIGAFFYVKNQEKGDSVTDEIKTIIGTAYVDEIEIQIMESFPVQVSVVAKGNLADACTALGDITNNLEDDTFFINIGTKRPADMMCSQALVPFEKIIPLEAEGLKAGVYNVNVNGIIDSFELQIDNIVNPKG